MQRLAVVGPAIRREELENIIQKNTKWNYSGHFDPASELAFIPKTDKGIATSFDVFLQNNESVFFINKHPLPFDEIEIAIKRAKNVYIENLHTLKADQLKKLSKLLPEIKATCMAGDLSLLPLHEIKNALPASNPRIIHIDRGIDLTETDLFTVLAEAIEIVYRLVDSECRKTDAINISTNNHRFDTLDAKINFSNASVAHIIIHPPYPKQDYKLSVYQNNGLFTSNLNENTLFAITGNHEFTRELKSINPTEKIKQAINNFALQIDQPTSYRDIMHKIAPMEILHALISKIKHISIHQ